jgi:hypothetical protein
LKVLEVKKFTGLDLDDMPDSDRYVNLDRKVLDQLKRVTERKGLGKINIGIDWR